MKATEARKIQKNMLYTARAISYDSLEGFSTDKEGNVTEIITRVEKSEISEKFTCEIDETTHEEFSSFVIHTDFHLPEGKFYLMLYDKNSRRFLLGLEDGITRDNLSFDESKDYGFKELVQKYRIELL